MASKCCRYASRLPCRLSSTISPRISIFHLQIPKGIRWLQRQPSRPRSFATAQKPTLSRSEQFSLRDIHLTHFERIVSRDEGFFFSSTPGDYYACAQKFSQRILGGASPWNVTFTNGQSKLYQCELLSGLSLPDNGSVTNVPILGHQSEDDVTPEILHDVGCIMRQMNAPIANTFAIALWSSASEMGHRPSTLTLARQLIRARAYGRLPHMKRVEARFKQLVAQGLDADALTAEGELLFEQGKYAAAIKVLERALDLSSRHEAGNFEWETYSRLCLGKALVKLKRYQDATAIFKSLSDAGLVEADIELGTMLRSSDRRSATQHLFTSACAGKREMFTLLSEMSLEDAAEAKDEKSRGNLRLWAAEWSRLADARVQF